MKFSYNWLKEYTLFKESPEKLAEFLTLRSFEVESVEKMGSDFVLDIKIHANRISDASGHFGLAKEIAAIKGLRMKMQTLSPKIKEDKKEKTSDYLSVRIENTDACLRYSARILGEIVVKPSPKWLRERLETCGVQSINNVVDAANYIMLLTGQPMHIFDFEALRARSKNKKTIIVRNAKKDEVMHALDEKTYVLTPETLVIADEEGPIAIAGIKGGKGSGVGEKTSGIILEAAHFSSGSIRASSHALSLRTDASISFENGLDPNQTALALDVLAELIQELAGGVILHGMLDIYPHKEKQSEILFRVLYANSIIGMHIESGAYHDLFQAIGCVVRAKRKDEFIIEPPTIRRDLKIEEDLIEEALRMIGLDEVLPVLPEVISLAPVKDEELFWEKKVLHFAASSGFFETLVYEFTGARELECFLLDSSEALELVNPASKEAQYLVPRVLIKYVGVAAENLRNFDSVRLFGIGKSFLKKEDTKKTKDKPPFEKKELVLVFAEKGSIDGDSFYVLKGVLDGLFESLGVADHWYDDAISHDTRKLLSVFHPHRVAEIKAGNTRLGAIGEIHPEILRNLKTKTRIVAAEIDFEKLWKIARSEQEFVEVSKFPPIVRDIALIVPETVKTETVLNIIENEGGELLIDTDLFDYFQDGAMRELQEKSLAFHLIFQSQERTLKDEEIEKIMNRIVTLIEEKGWEVRK